MPGFKNTIKINLFIRGNMSIKKVELNNNEQPVLMAVLAHPDDESFGMGGTLAKYAKLGVDVYLVCATRGEVGEMDEQYLRGYDSPAARREDELRCAAEKLGIKEVIFLDYRDSGMAGSPHNIHPQSLFSAPLREVAEKVAHLIRKYKPQVLITFDPIGGYRHPDHIKIHEATISAYSLAASAEDYHDFDNLEPFRPVKLYYHTIPRGFLRFTVKLLKFVGKDPQKFGKNKDIDLLSITDVDFPIDAVIDYREVAELKSNANACHASQGGSKLGGGIMGWLRVFFGSKDLFMRAVPTPSNADKKEADLFSWI